MRTEQQLRDALQLLVEPAPDADDVLTRFHVPVPVARRTRSRRSGLVAIGVGLALVLLGALVVPQLVRRSSEPAGLRVAGSWAMVSHLEPPQGWSSGGYEISGTYETSSVSDPTGKGVCWVEVDGQGVVPRRAFPAAAQAVTVGGQPASYAAPPGREDSVFWHYSPNAWASISCAPGPSGLGAARTPPEVRKVIIGLAESMTFGEYPLRVPVRIAELPSGYRVASVAQDDPKWAASWGIDLSPVNPGPTSPAIHLGPSLGSVPDANSRVGGYPAAFFTEPIHGPVTRVPRTEVSYTSLCVLSAPVGICVTATNTAADDPESRRDLFHDLTEHFTYADRPADTTTWFDARTALPS